MSTTFPTKVGQTLQSSFGSGRQFVFDYIAGTPEGGNGAWEFIVIEPSGSKYKFSNPTGWGTSEITSLTPELSRLEPEIELEVEQEAYESLLDAMGVPQDIKNKYWQLEGWEFDEQGNLVQSGTDEISDIAKDISPL